MIHPITENWPFHNYKAFIIYNKGSMLSRWSAGRTLGTAKRCGVDAELFNGIHKDDHKRVMRKFGLRWHPFAETWGATVHNMDAVAGCFLSHYSLWKKCIELKEPIMILEHDVEFNDKVIIPKEYGDWDGIINIGQPIWGTWWVDYLEKIKGGDTSFRMHERDITGCEKPHAPYGIFDEDRKDYCACDRNFLVGAHSYIITPNTAVKLLDKAKRVGIDRADVFMDSKTFDVVDLLPYPTTQVRRFSLIDKGHAQSENAWQDSDWILPIYPQEAVYYNDELILPCSPKWKDWLQFKKDYPDMVRTLYDAQEHANKGLKFGKILFDNKEVIKGEKDGLFRDYFDDGESIRCEGIFQDGEMQGEWIYYLIDGSVDAKYYLDNGKLTRMDRHSWRQGQK